MNSLYTFKQLPQSHCSRIWWYTGISGEQRDIIDQCFTFCCEQGEIIATVTHSQFTVNLRLVLRQTRILCVPVKYVGTVIIGVEHWRSGTYKQKDYNSEANRPKSSLAYWDLNTCNWCNTNTLCNEISSHLKTGGAGLIIHMLSPSIRNIRSFQTCSN